MKKLLVVLTLLTSFVARADMDEASVRSTEPTAAEVESSRSCFKELETYGCRHPREDLEQFRSCMENVSASLTPNCQKMVGKLYHKRQ